MIHYGALERPPAEFGLSRTGQQQPAAATGRSARQQPSEQRQPAVVSAAAAAASERGRRAGDAHQVMGNPDMPLVATTLC